MAMTPTKARAFIAAALALLVGGCGTGANDPLITALGVVSDSVFDRGGDDATTPLTAATVPPTLLAQVEGPVIFVETPQLGGATLMTRVGQNGPDSTWRGPEGFGLTLGAGNILRSTRGLGFDLMASDTAALSAALSARRPGPTPRIELRLDGEGRQTRQTLDCTLTHDGPDTITIVGRARQTTRMSETCRTESGSHQNLFWVDAAGTAIQSLQWVGGPIGAVRITDLRR